MPEEAQGSPQPSGSNGTGLSGSTASASSDSSSAESPVPLEEQCPNGLWSQSWRGARRQHGIGACGITKVLLKWRQMTAIFNFKMLVVCSLCGMGTFGGRTLLRDWTSVAQAPGSVPFYSFMNAVHGGVCSLPDGRCFLCPSCSKKGDNPRLEHVVFTQPRYTRAVLCLDPALQMQLSLVRVGTGFMSHAYGFTTARVSEPSIVPAALVNWHPNAAQQAFGAPQPMLDVLATNIDMNPLLQTYLSVLEQPAATGFLAPDAVSRILGDHRERGPLQTEAETNIMRSMLSVVMPNAEAHVRAGHDLPTLYTAGTLHVRGHSSTMPTTQPLRVAVDGSAAAETPAAASGVQVSAELALFPFLFPYACGAFMGAGLTFAEYLRYRSHCFLSPFTLCKAYILLMYVMRQSSQLQSSRTLVRPSCIQAAGALCRRV